MAKGGKPIWQDDTTRPTVPASVIEDRNRRLELAARGTHDPYNNNPVLRRAILAAKAARGLKGQ
jgi:hypothetical protein